MKVKIKKLDKNAVIPFKEHDSDFCYDCVAVSEEEIAPNVWKYGLGLSFEIERDSEILSYGKSFSDNDGCVYAREIATYIDFDKSPIKLSIDARPRSSIYKTGMVLSNCVGTIDEHYRGEVCAIFYHVMPNMPRYKVGDKICQIKLGMTFPMEFEECEILSETDRGEGGFGSTGR